MSYPHLTQTNKGYNIFVIEITKLAQKQWERSNGKLLLSEYLSEAQSPKSRASDKCLFCWQFQPSGDGGSKRGSMDKIQMNKNEIMKLKFTDMQPRFYEGWFQDRGQNKIP